LWQNVTNVIAQDGWLLLAVIGLALLPAATSFPRASGGNPEFHQPDAPSVNLDARQKHLGMTPTQSRRHKTAAQIFNRSFWHLNHASAVTLAFLLLPFVLLGRTTPLFSLSAYYLIPLFPLMALGVANVVRPRRGAPITYVVATLFVTLALLPLTLSHIAQTREGFHTDIDPFLLNPQDAARAAAYLNDVADADDVVIASPGVAWSITARTADMQMPIAYRGTATPHLPANLPSNRWAFSPDYNAARFVVIDNLWRNWAMPNIPGVAEMVRDVAEWPLVFHAGEIVIYQNPER
jgi:hypothetical protein